MAKINKTITDNELRSGEQKRSKTLEFQRFRAFS